MEKDIIIFNGRTFIRYPNAKCQADQRYYKGWVKIDGKRKKTTLHRYKWETITEKRIPPRHDVHHMDEDYLNNDFSNYEIISRSEHQSMHMKNQSDELKAKRIHSLLTVAQEAAKIWHKSDEGRAWHSGEAKKNFATDPTEHICLKCNTKFISVHLSHTTYCSLRCGNAYRAMIHRQRYPKSKKVA